jgi:hypothetical protein
MVNYSFIGKGENKLKQSVRAIQVDSDWGSE